MERETHYLSSDLRKALSMVKRLSSDSLETALAGAVKALVERSEADRKWSRENAQAQAEMYARGGSGVEL
ncbi:MAG: hypothetical protein Q7R74_01365 [bacterium]|nr:hypothetical protein [bacterium]